MALFTSILCAVDFSEHSERALQASLQLALVEKAVLVVVTVIDPLLMEAASVSYQHDAVARQARGDLAALTATLLGSEGGRADGVYTHVSTGKPSREILRAAEAWHSDVIVVGTHGLGGVKKLFFGSTTERVLHDAGVAVLAVPACAGVPAIAAGRPVVLAVALDRPADALVSDAGRLADDLGSELIVVHALEPVQLAPGLRAVATEDPGRRERAQEQLERLVGSVRVAHGARAILADGEPATVLPTLLVETRAALLTVGLGRPESVEPRPGTTAYRLVCAAPVPVLALNERAG